ncbi:SDR family NAD(P)-dependent oxidoreductase [Marisediminicola sp. LYQ134]|uniref:SDR family NAD(P)-dependent oxidoreductase n=1 Tax=Marisediminicola sp. LYQ134 TaxID=3391061 RepID=UPI0039834ACE
MSERLEGKTALVTGAAAGIGRGIAARLASEGARVILADRDEAGAVAAAHEIVSAGAIVAARGMLMDISDEASVTAAFTSLVDDGWVPDVVVANAGVQLFGRDAKVADLDLDSWQRTIDVNLTGTFLTLKHAVRAMLPNGGGSIILTGSPTGIRGEGAEFTAYSTSKAAIHGLGRTVAAAYVKDGIRVNTVVPAYTETPLVSAITSDPESRAAIISRIPMGRAGSPGDIEGIVVFFASDESAFATGTLVAVDGGMTTL